MIRALNTCVAAGAFALAACSGKPPPEATKPIQVATPPSERKAPASPVTAPAATAPAAPAAPVAEMSPAEKAAASADALAHFGARMDQASVLTRANSVLAYHIDRFKENNGRWPRSLAEAGIGRIDLPPGKKVQYNAATGQATITD